MAETMAETGTDKVADSVTARIMALSETISITETLIHSVGERLKKVYEPGKADFTERLSEVLAQPEEPLEQTNLIYAVDRLTNAVGRNNDDLRWIIDHLAI